MKTVKLLLVSVIVLFSIENLLAQKISGTVADVSSRGVADVVINLRRADSTFISSTISDVNGHFSILLPHSKSVILQAVQMSYMPFVQKMAITQDTTINIVLDTSTINLEEVTVTGTKRAIFNRDGDIIVNVTNMKGVENINAQRLMQRIPGVALQGGELKLFGINATVFINGVKQTMPTNVLLTYLESLPANSISQIELITTPRSDFDASIGAVIDTIVR